VDGVQVTNHQVKVQALTEYFKSIVGVPGQSSWSFDCASLYRDMPRATDALTEPFTEQETLAAIKGMNRCSAPGPDGFGPSFYMAAWGTIRDDLMDFLRAFHAEQAQLERLNRSHMVLIPKKHGATEVHAVLQQFCIASLMGDLHGQHWENVALSTTCLPCNHHGHVGRRCHHLLLARRVGWR
jgi:hypothetical protein